MTKHQDSIAIIGIGCRFPGNASNPRKFWKMLCEGTDAITEVPKNRWDPRRFYDSNIHAAGKMYVKKGGFLSENWEDFDAEFFRISPREADYLDPQQRLLLELSWEALEDSGIIPQNIAGSDTGVFIGGFTTDWQTMQNSPYNLNHCSTYTGINSSLTILSARLAHFFDFKGPCLTVDTACSSSLVAVHLACQNLWQNACSLAFAGGVNAMLMPETTVALSKGRFLNPDGYCKSFDADAKGYIRGEGGGVVILKKLSAALKDKDPIYAIIRGTGINHDGYTQGIAMPNPQAQESLIRKVISESNISPCQISYVEAHGTGTSVGDPIEAQALNAILNISSRSHPCYVGAVKTNIGHLEAAAGIAGLIKTALCLRHKKIPPNLHFKNANPNIPFEKYCLKIPTTLLDLPEHQDAYFAGVNSFGYGGTNAHVILQNYEPSISSKSSSPTYPFLFPFSAQNPESLKSLAISTCEFLKEHPDTCLSDLAHTLASKRTHLEHRFTISAESIQELGQKLHSLSLDGRIPESCAKGKPLDKKPLLIFAFTGMGPQWWWMGRELMKSSPIFLETLKQCDLFLLPLANWSIIDELQKEETNTRMDDPQVAQVANFALQISLTQLLKSWGVHPDAMVGHSIGEVAAAVAAGALTLQEGILTSYHRSRVQSLRKNSGTMLAVGLGKNECEGLLKEYSGKISIAAENSTRSITLAGSKDDLMSFAEVLEKNNIFNKLLNVNIAYHSHQMDGLENEIVTSLHSLKPQKPKIPLFSTVFTDECEERKLDANYWWHNVRQPVLFAQTMQNVINKGYNIVIEIGPHPVLASYIKDCWQSSQSKGINLSTLKKNKPELPSLMECLGGLYAAGYPLSWEHINPNSGNFIHLPGYPWQKKKFWIESDQSVQYRLSSHRHPLLSRKLNTPNETWQVEINSHHFSWLHDHQIDGTVVFPAAAYIEAGLALSGSAPCVLEEISFKQVLAINAEKEAVLQLSLDNEKKSFSAHSQTSGDNTEWMLHATGKICSFTVKPNPETFELKEFQKLSYLDGETVYQQFTEKGLDYGPAFQGIKKLWKKDNEAIAEIRPLPSMERYLLHPTLLDAALQTLIGTINIDSAVPGIILPSFVNQLIFHSQPQDIVYCQAKCIKQTDNKIIGDLLLCDESGNVFTQIRGLECQIIKNDDTKKIGQILYTSTWEENPLKKEVLNFSNQFWMIGSFQKSSTNHIDKNITGCFFDATKLQTLETAKDLIKPHCEKNNLQVVLDFTQMPTTENLETAEISKLIACINLVKALENRSQLATLWILTHKTQAVLEMEEQALEGSTLWGLCRVIRQEYPHLRCRLIDIDNNPGDISILISESMQDNTDDEIAWRKNKRYIHKIKHSKSLENPKNLSLSAPHEAFSLKQKSPGLLDSLYFEQIESTPPADKEVGIQIHTTSLNFKDLMKILGIIDPKALEDTYFGNTLGMECTGTIVSLGKNVKGYKIGDQVCCFSPNTFQSYINVSTKAVFPIPTQIPLEEAPIYIPFITVLRGLKQLAGLKKGETILIHSATGAVGLAAIQYAQHIGAKIIATASSEEKRKYLNKIGIEACADSRSLTFVEDVLKWTHGKGVDVILNSLSNDALIKSWSLLAPYGRFIEIGKVDISKNSPLPMGKFNQNTVFASIDLDRAFIDKPALIHHLLKEARKLFQKGIFKSLPCKIFPASDAIPAFQFMARAKHIGKVMLMFNEQTVPAVPYISKKSVINANSSYLITGGFSGFGLLTAKWLVQKGAKNLILISRSGPVTSEAKTVLQQLKSLGINIEAASVDITNINQLNNLLKKCEKTMPPLKGIIHSAMVLHDALISELTSENISKVLLPKISGCLNLHKCTSTYPLDFFVLFSSVSSIIGNPGQGNYAAANAFLDSFCNFRKKQNLPATTINWGALKLGILLRNPKVAKHLESNGIRAIHPSTALKILEKAIQENPTRLCAIDVDWHKMMQNMPSIKKSSVFSDFYEQTQNDPSNAFLYEIKKLDDSQRLNFTIDSLKEMIGKTLKMNAIDENARLNTIGVDSLMAMELHAMMESNLGIRIPSMELMKGPSIKQLAFSVLRELGKNV